MSKQRNFVPAGFEDVIFFYLFFYTDESFELNLTN